MTETPEAGARAQPPSPRPPPRTAVAGDVVLVAVCVLFLWRDVSAILAGDVKLVMRTWTFMLNLACVFVLVHRAMALAQRAVPPGRGAHMMGMAKWALALTVPLMAAGQIEREVHKVHRARLDVLAADIATRTAAALATDGAVAAASLASVDNPYLRALTVRTDTGAFLLEVAVPALDADGYAGRYSSTERRWHINHNDLGAESAPVFDASGPTLQCRPSVPGLSCQ